jgi:hypothetical protein
MWIMKMLAGHLGAGPKDLLNATVIHPPPTPAPTPTPMPPGCFVAANTDYKFAPGNVFPTDAAHPHGLRLVDNEAQCCAMCQSLKNCSFWTFEHGGTAAKPTCYQYSGACCLLKTAAAAGNSVSNPTATSGSMKPIPTTGPLFALPYILHDATKTRGLLLVNKMHTGVMVKLSAATLSAGADANWTAMVLEGVGPEPGFNPPVERAVVVGGALSIGPFGVALLTVA